MRHLLLAASALAMCCAGAAPAAAAAAPAAKPAANKVIPVAVFAEHPFLTDPEISPDGTHFAAKVRSKGEKYLAIFDVANPSAPPQVIGKDGEFDKVDNVNIADWEWADADNLIVRAFSRQSMNGEQADIWRLLGFNRKTGKVTPLGWDNSVTGGRILWKSRSGSPRLLLERISQEYGYEGFSQPEVVEVDVLTGRYKTVVKPNPLVSTWYADGEGNVRMGTSTDRESGKLRILYRSGGDGSFRTVSNEKQSRYGSSLVPSLFLAEPDKALVMSNASGFNELYELDLKTMELGKKVFSRPGYDIGGPIANRERNALMGVAAVEDRLTYYWTDPTLKSIQEMLEEGLGKGNVRIASRDADGKRMIVQVGGPSQAGSYLLYDSSTGNITRLAWANETFQDTPMNPVKTIRYKASDGQEIPAVLTLPRHREAKNLPLIVLPHGGPWARDMEQWDHWSQALAELGYAVVQPNYRGSTGFGKKWTELADGNWGTRMQDDLDDSITALAQLGIADPKRVCMFGWSYGGYAASRAAQRGGGKYRCAISGAGVHDIPAMVKYDRNYLGRYGSSFIGGASTDLRNVSPAYHPEQYSIPIMIVHGAKDERVPVAQSRDLVKGLRAAGKKEGVDFVYVEQPRNTHQLPLEADRVQLLEEIQKFLAKHNPA
ncbi:MAG: S9 family peptidase [Alphaproteobacteria bacterium]|nr:MAG: S9 family peptidase [Alphaproteobacteria bacterium]